MATTVIPGLLLVLIALAVRRNHIRRHHVRQWHGSLAGAPAVVDRDAERVAADLVFAPCAGERVRNNRTSRAVPVVPGGFAH